MAERIQHILVIQLERLGDLVQTTPLIRDLQRVYPTAAIDVLAWSEFAPIVDELGVTIRTLSSARVKELNDNIALAPAALKELGLPRYDWIINVSHEPFAAWLTEHLNPKRKDGGALTAQGEWLYAGDWLTLLVAISGIRRDNRFNLVDLYRGPATAGPPPADAHADAAAAATLEFELPEGPLAVIAPGANEAHRQFVIAPTLQTISELVAMGFRIAIVGAQADRPLIRTITDSCAFPLIDLSGRTNVRQLTAVLKRAEIVLTADSGPAHIAAALGRPLVSLYGACLAPMTTAPWGGGHVFLVNEHMDAFTSSIVMAAVRFRLGSGNLADLNDVRRETAAAGVEAWQTAMLPVDADPLGGVTYRSLHRERLDQPETLRRLMRHTMAAAISGKPLGNLSGLWESGTMGSPDSIAHAAQGETTLRRVAADVNRGLAQLRRKRFDGLQDLVVGVTSTVERLKEEGLADPIVAPVIAFLDSKLRMMPAYEPQQIFQEYARELNRAAGTLEMARKALSSMM